MKKTLGLLALLLLSGCGAGRQAGIPLPQPQAEAQATAPLSYPVRVHNAVSRELRLPERARPTLHHQHSAATGRQAGEQLDRKRRRATVRSGERGGAARAVSADGQRHRVCAVQRRGARFRSLKM
ncbi:hypothetical protein PTR03_05665 [Serratia nevei]|uniref:hypothetical protein n=1 Tax=Serratia TaxID=613 RepID=UPI001ED91C26|nr:hypothetical protein [Serratia marcescens]